MGEKAKREYLAAIRERYRKAGKREKGIILGEFCFVCRYHRKHAIRLLNERSPTRKGRVGRKAVYDQAPLLRALKRIWLAADQICSKKLVVALPQWLPFYEQSYERLSAEVREKLLLISAATIDRLLAPTRAKVQRKGLTGTKPGTLLKNQIPIRSGRWDVSQPGFMEADTVAHCGNSLAGDFIWSLTLTDISSTWTESRATWNNGASGVVKAIKDVESSLPFDLKGFDCDNGSEFLNHHLLRYFTDRSPKVKFTRSRPYKKNDNAHVEQKNWSYVRQLLGYHRLDNPALLPLINDLYANQWSLLQNHFLPTFKLKAKTRIGSKYRRVYDPPKTPYQRLLHSTQISVEAKEKLIKQHQSLDPFRLRKQIDKQLKEIFNLVSVTSIGRKRI